VVDRPQDPSAGAQLCRAEDHGRGQLLSSGNGFRITGESACERDLDASV